MESIEIKNQNETFVINDLTEADIVDLRPVLEQCIKDKGKVLYEEIQEVEERMKQSIDPNRGLQFRKYKYVVARDSSGKAIGCAGVSDPDTKMIYLTRVNDGYKPAEMVNVFLSEEYRGRGLGKELVYAAKGKAMELGYHELLWKIGPGYSDTARDFYTRLIGEPYLQTSDFHGEGSEATVWRINL